MFEADYLWFKWEKALLESGSGWNGRFPEGAKGFALWQNAWPLLAEPLQIPEEENPHGTSLPPDVSDPLARFLVASRIQPTRRGLSYPRLFISHRQADLAPALRIAELATNAGFLIWLDVLDPNLQLLGQAGGGTAYQKALTTAFIIEMALLNCTHVLAAVTDRTIGSAWVPYEYGRVKTARMFSTQASAWIDPTRIDPILPEYMLLNPLHDSETKITAWLKMEMKRWRAAKAIGAHYSQTKSCLGRPWPYQPTSPLPALPGPQSP